ncbi:hypothetical protein BCEN4_1180011 [Burkholderia cenocepacia]|nr:hypothetical protein BCEN4_1180011 [Burkholderia cenocepacia]
MPADRRRRAIAARGRRALRVVGARVFPRAESRADDRRSGRRPATDGRADRRGDPLPARADGAVSALGGQNQAVKT